MSYSRRVANWFNDCTRWAVGVELKAEGSFGR
jgi:hypothetical protein